MSVSWVNHTVDALSWPAAVVTCTAKSIDVQTVVIDHTIFLGIVELFFSLTQNINSKYKKKTWIDLPRLPRAVSGIFSFCESRLKKSGTLVVRQQSGSLYFWPVKERVLPVSVWTYEDTSQAGTSACLVYTQVRGSSAVAKKITVKWNNGKT